MAFDAVWCEQLFEYISCVLLGHPMVNIDESYSFVSVLHLVVFAVGCDIDVCLLCDGVLDELCARTTA